MFVVIAVWVVVAVGCVCCVGMFSGLLWLVWRLWFGGFAVGFCVLRVWLYLVADSSSCVLV